MKRPDRPVPLAGSSQPHRFVPAQPTRSPAARLVHRLCLWAVAAAFLWWPVSAAGGASPSPVLTEHDDNGRTGAYLSETLLNTANVNVAQFGKLFTRPMDGQIYAQPLYVPGLAAVGGIHNWVFVATMHNSVYAVDADAAGASAPLRQTRLGTAAPITYTIANTTTVGHDFGPPGYSDIAGEVGVISTPVIDPNTNTLYVVAFTKEPDPPTRPCHYAHRLHALDSCSARTYVSAQRMSTRRVREAARSLP